MSYNAWVTERVPDVRPFDRQTGLVEADMAMLHAHHEDDNDLGGRMLDMVILFGAITLFVGAVAAFFVIAT